MEVSLADLVGVAVLIVVLAILWSTRRAPRPPATGPAMPIHDDGTPRALDELDEVERWFVYEVDRRCGVRGGRLRCDRCGKIAIDTNQDQRVRLFCDADVGQIFCAECAEPEPAAVGQRQGRAGRRRGAQLRVVK